MEKLFYEAKPAVAFILSLAGFRLPTTHPTLTVACSVTLLLSAIVITYWRWQYRQERDLK